MHAYRFGIMVKKTIFMFCNIEKQIYMLATFTKHIYRFGNCYCSMFCCYLLYVHSSIAIILMGKSELAALLSLSSRCLVMVFGSSSRCHGFGCDL